MIDVNFQESIEDSLFCKESFSNELSELEYSLSPKK